MLSRFRAVSCFLLLASVMATCWTIASAGTAVASSRAFRAVETSQSYPWKGNHSCRVQLPEPHGIVTYKEFNTCPPKRVLLVGDSVGLTMGIQMGMNETNWGTLVDTKADLGCGFVTGYERNPTGNGFAAGNPACNQALATWVADERQLKPDAVLVEMGWWDSQPHLINGTIESLGQPGYDAMVSQDIVNFIQQLRTASNAPIFFLSVPWMNPQWPNGQENPAATAASHEEINTLIQAASQSASKVHFIDVSPYVTPSGQYQEEVDGQVCRDPDGIHLYTTVPGTIRYVMTKCGQALQRGVLSKIRTTLGK